MRSLLLLLVLAAPCALAQSDDVTAALAAANEQFMQGFNTGDAAAIAGLFATDGRISPPGAPDFTGPAAVAQYFQGAFDAGLSRLDLTTDEVIAGEDVAQEFGHYTLYAGEQPVDEGRYVVTWKREGETWRIYRDLYNSSQPAPEAPGRAAQGERVGIATWTIAEGQSAAFRQWVEDMLRPAAFEVEPEAAAAVQFLAPLGANTDGTSTYTFVFNPLVEGADYTVGGVLARAYGEEAAREHLARLDGVVVGEPGMVLLSQAW